MSILLNYISKNGTPVGNAKRLKCSCTLWNWPCHNKHCVWSHSHFFYCYCWRAWCDATCCANRTHQMDGPPRDPSFWPFISWYKYKQKYTYKYRYKKTIPNKLHLSTGWATKEGYPTPSFCHFTSWYKYKHKNTITDTDTKQIEIVMPKMLHSSTGWATKGRSFCHFTSCYKYKQEYSYKYRYKKRYK